MTGTRFQGPARFAAFLAFAVTVQFCFLNPQPEPPADNTSCPACGTAGRGPTTGGSGGSAGAGTGGGGGSLPPIDPGNDAAPRDGATGSSDAATDRGSADGADDATDGGGDEPDTDDGAQDGANGDDASDATTDVVPDVELDAMFDGDAGVADAGAEPKRRAQP